MTAAIIIWVVLAIVVGVLLLYRYSITSHEDDSVHLAHETAKTSDQAVLANRISSVDRWGKVLTALVAAYGLALIIYWISATAFSPTRGT